MEKLVYVDMDGVLADYAKLKDELDLEYASSGSSLEERPEKWHRVIDNFYLDLDPLEGAIEAFHALCEAHEVYILSTPSWYNPHSWTDKRLWVENHLGSVAKKRLILSHNKSLLRGDYLIDDRTANGAAEFPGEHIHFGNDPYHDWDAVLSHLLE